MNNLQKVYVVGFPKSGNTWLTRLLADCLGSPAGSGMRNSENIEIATDLNQAILDKNPQPGYKILKTHYLPSVLEKEIDNQ